MDEWILAGILSEIVADSPCVGGGTRLEKSRYSDLGECQTMGPICSQGKESTSVISLDLYQIPTRFHFRALFGLPLTADADAPLDDDDDAGAFACTYCASNDAPARLSASSAGKCDTSSATIERSISRVPA